MSCLVRPFFFFIGTTLASAEIFLGGRTTHDSAASNLNVAHAKTSVRPGPCLLPVNPCGPDRRSRSVSSHRSGNGSRSRRLCARLPVVGTGPTGRADGHRGAGARLVLWSSACYLVLESRQRSLRWLSLAAVGPFGFIVLAI